MLGSRRRLRLSRSPFVFWLAVAGLALLTASTVARAIGSAQSLAARYGPLRPLVVAARPVAAGAAIGGGDVGVRLVPASARPPGAFSSPGEVKGRTPVVPLLVGEPVLPGHLAPEGLSGVAALLPAGTRAVAVPTGTSSPPLHRGDVVDVLATLDGGPTLAVAVDSPVVDVAQDAATVAVTPEEAKAVAFAVTTGAVTVTLTPGVAGGVAAAPGAPAAPRAASQRAPVATRPTTATPAAKR
jgi:Flp pilus assembly protein CpaB